MPRAILILALWFAAAMPAAAPAPAQSGPRPIYDVVAVTIEPVAGRPGAVRVVAIGRAPTAGWTRPELRPRPVPNPIPEKLAFDFVAEPPPPDRFVAQVLTEIRAEYVIERLGLEIRVIEVQATRNRVEAPVKSS